MLNRIFLFLLIGLTPIFAQAADIGPFEVGADDISLNKLLKPLFGTLVGGGTDPLSAVLGPFNAVIMIIGGILLAYGLVAGTMQTAHDGEVLGRRWSSMWLPLRISLGVSAITPIGSAGYCVVQYIVMWLVLQGVGAANMLWSAYTQNTTALAQPTISVNFDKGAELSKIVLQQELCVLTINTAVSEAKKTNPDIPYGTVSVLAIDSTAGDKTGAGKQNGFQSKTCGTYSVPRDLSVDTTNINSWFGKTFDKVNFSQAITAGYNEAFQNLRVKLNGVAVKIIEGAYENKTNDLSSDFKNAVDSYNQSLQNVVVGATAGATMTNDVAKNASKDGWGMAGAWFMKYVYVKAELAQKTNFLPFASPPNAAYIPSEFRTAYEGFLHRYNSIEENTSYKTESGLKQQISDDSEESFWKFKMNLNESLFNSLTKDKHPLIAAKDFGDYVFSWTMGIATALAGAAGIGSAVLSKIPFIGKDMASAIQTAAILLLPIYLAAFGALIGFSAYLAFYLPVAPFIIWFGLLIGWLVMVVEAVIAAPLWAMVHIHPDGDGIVGRGGQGYSLVLALTLRPALAIIGLICALVLMEPVGRLFFDTFWGAYKIAQGNNSMYGLFTFIACFVIFSVTFVTIIQKIMALIHVIPDQILQWIGGPSGNLGQYGGAMGESGAGAATKVGAAAGALANQAGSTASNFRQLQEQKKNTIAQEKGNRIAAGAKAQQAEQELGSGMGAATLAADEAMEKLYDNGGTPTNEAVQAAREKAMQTSYDAKHGEGSWKARGEFDNARAANGLGPASGADYNRWERSRVTHGENHYGAKKYVDDIINKGTSEGGSASRAADNLPPTAPTHGTGKTSGDDSKTT